ncbi:MAG: GTPase ObgE [Anaerovoracaceae bacterium]|nr:GTPase ObgE [Bacillota bacterium]MDY5907095.1 GTPase ObgE [Anaerovoracaceae bacterium]
MFVDRARINVKSGKGGNGAVSFRREPFVPEGGPDGGDGGKGGDVIFEASSSYRTLMDFKYKKKYEAEPGQDGMKKKKFGKNGENLVIKVPPGTVIIDELTGLVMKDLVYDGDSVVVVKGGKGGKGNVHFKNSVRQAPNFAEAGGPARERNIILELKLIADVGLLGFPNVGKSTLLSVSTSARPKIANYHFTTITPNLGVVQIYDSSFVMADIPGLVEGAHEGTGLGLDFLKHVDRTKVLVHVVDIAGSEGRDPVEDFDKINDELVKYSERLAKKPQIVVGNKSDLVFDEDTVERFKKHVEDKGYQFFLMSAATNQGVREVLSAAAKALAELPEEEEQYEFYDFSMDDEEPDYREIYTYVDDEDGAFVIEGKQLTKIFDSTNFNDMESLRYLYKYIENKGAIAELKELGLKEGDTVRIKDYEFEYEEE